MASSPRPFSDQTMEITIKIWKKDTQEKGSIFAEMLSKLNRLKPYSTHNSNPNSTGHRCAPDAQKSGARKDRKPLFIAFGAPKNQHFLGQKYDE